MPPFTSGPRGVSSTSILASAAAAEIVAVAARRGAHTTDLLRSGPTATLNGRNVPAHSPIPSSSATLTVTGAVTPIRFCIAGVDYELDTAKTILCSAGWNRISINASGTLTIESAAPAYKITQPAAPSAGDLWYSLLDRQMYKYSGSAWVAYNVVMLCYAYVTGGVITRVVNLPYNWCPWTIRRYGGTGADGSKTWTSGTQTLNSEYHYTEVLASGTGVLTQSTGGNMPTYHSQGPFAFVDTAAITFNGTGRAGGAGVSSATTGSAGSSNGWGASGGGGGGGNATVGGAGGHSNGQVTGVSVGNFGGGAGGTAGNPGTAATAFLTPETDESYEATCGPGNGGGAGGGVAGQTSGAGGRGAGAFRVRAQAYLIGASATVTCTGADGGAPTGANAGGGGSGGGGKSSVRAGTIQDHNGSTHTAAPGAIGQAVSGAGNGAQGATGNIRLTEITP